jgi:polyhydroxyalkanoate synthesis regulator phasin
VLRDYYKRARAEAEEEESCVRQRMSEAVDDLEGFPAQEAADANQQMEDMIEDLHRPARRQGSGRQGKARIQTFQRYSQLLEHQFTMELASQCFGQPWRS